MQRGLGARPARLRSLPERSVITPSMITRKPMSDTRPPSGHDPDQQPDREGLRDHERQPDSRHMYWDSLPEECGDKDGGDDYQFVIATGSSPTQSA